jgi:hypothetical protein
MKNMNRAPNEWGSSPDRDNPVDRRHEQKVGATPPTGKPDAVDEAAEPNDSETDGPDHRSPEEARTIGEAIELGDPDSDEDRTEAEEEIFPSTMRTAGA